MEKQQRMDMHLSHPPIAQDQTERPSVVCGERPKKGKVGLKRPRLRGEADEKYILPEGVKRARKGELKNLDGLDGKQKEKSRKESPKEEKFLQLGIRFSQAVGGTGGGVGGFN